MSKYRFFETKDEKVYFTGGHMEVYIPNDYFKEEIAVMVGNSIQTLGIFHFGVFPNENKTDIKDGTIYSLNLPLDILVNFSKLYKDQRKLKDEIPSRDYTILSIKKDDIFIEQTKIIKGIEAVEKFASKLLHGGKLPPDIRYEDVIKLYHQCLEFNLL